ncbi:MAG TPA: hypothetical protein VHV08_09110 [Pirellulales bacterium]|nr:hypothetical protein [Pirellulales bacterium]
MSRVQQHDGCEAKLKMNRSLVAVIFIVSGLLIVTFSRQFTEKLTSRNARHYGIHQGEFTVWFTRAHDRDCHVIYSIWSIAAYGRLEGDGPRLSQMTWSDWWRSVVYRVRQNYASSYERPQNMGKMTEKSLMSA